jgi:superfamily I DNA/RNA helicase
MPSTSPASLAPLFAEVAAEPLSLGALSLNPEQRSIVERSYDGPALVTGAPGTGKTTVALHRAAFLAAAGDVLFVAFSKHLAAGLRDRLPQLGVQVPERVDVTTIDALAVRVAAEAEPDRPRHWMDDSRALELWRVVLEKAGLPDDGDWTPEFLHEEWTQVVLGHAINSRFDYLGVRRAGRGRRLNRAARGVAWHLIEQYTGRLSEANLWTFRQLIAHAVGLETAREAERGPRYRHVVADEAQDLSAAQLKLLRAMVAPGPDDLFLVGDPGQRVYGTGASLASLGIDVRDRSAELTRRFRPAVVPELRGHASLPDELAEILRQVRDWGSSQAIGIAVPDSAMAAEVEGYLTAHDVTAAPLGADGPRVTDAVHVGVLHRFKGLEYERMILAGLDKDAVVTRPLLDMAASRARESLVITWHGAPSSLLVGIPE